MKKFDLNIEQILENWEVHHAVREIIANAIDEQKLTNSAEIKIFKDDEGQWHIRDYGRGINVENFTQNENEEKLKTEGIIGKFGIGLKDALATFDRNNIDIKIKSKNGEFTIGKSIKTGFDELVTLHIYINPNRESSFIGTEFVLSNINDYDIKKAKDVFLKFSKENVIDSCSYGMILDKNNDDVGRIFINGLNVSEEENFLFSYNITNINASIRKALNRERTNLGRTAYSATIKLILLNCKSHGVVKSLANDFKNYSYGTVHDETKWIDVQEYAVKFLNHYENAVFVTTDEIESSPDLIDEIKSSGYEMINIPSNLKEKVFNESDHYGEIVRELDKFKMDRMKNFEFNFVKVDNLKKIEKQNYYLIDNILALVGGKPANVNEILVSETMQKDPFSFGPAAGLWEYDKNRIIIKRSLLGNTEDFVAVLLHEIAHAKSGATDATRDFENELTRMIGTIGFKVLDQQQLIISNQKRESDFSFIRRFLSLIRKFNISFR